MNNDLISRSELGKLVEESMNNNPHKDGKIACNHNAEHIHFLKLIADMPTADNTDEVMEQLEERVLLIKEQLLDICEEDEEAVRLRCRMRGLDEAIEIVKAEMKG